MEWVHTVTRTNALKQNTARANKNKQIFNKFIYFTYFYIILILFVFNDINRIISNKKKYY